MESNDRGPQIISTTTSGGRSQHMRMLAVALATASPMHSVRDQDEDNRKHLPFGGLSYQSSGRSGEIRTSGKGEPRAAIKRAKRKTKKKMRQQSRKK